MAGRNEPCPCGSGKKFKRCCGAGNGQVHVSAARKGGGEPQPSLESESVEMARNAAGEAQAALLTGYHLDVLFGGVRLAGLDFKQLFAECMQATQTSVPRWKVPRRAQRALNLGRYFLRSLEVEGSRAECGTLKGFSALLLCRLARSLDNAYAGEGLHVVDSFEGLSEPRPQDAVRVAGAKNGVYPAEKGLMACPLDHVRAVLREYPAISFHKGWIPQALAGLPETRWAFVHVDVDLYEPTLGCLEYFVPRLAPGGIIVNDDYASPLFPGGGIAWDEFCKRHGLAFAALDSGQAVLVKGL